MPLATPGRNQGPTIGNNRQSGGGRAALVCAVISVALFTASVRMGPTGPLAAVRGGFQTLTEPVRALGAAAGAPFRGLGNVFTNLTADQQTLTELRDENAQLQARNVQLEEAEQTAQRLQGLLDLRGANDLQSTAARVISGSADSWSTTLSIDKGTADGVAPGMPVTASSGVIGQVVESGPTSSVVRLLTDESSSVSAMVQATRVQGMLVGSPSGQLSLTLVRTNQTVSVGDVVVTSGLGGSFPKGLPIGKVTSVENNPGSLYLDVTVEPFARAEGYEEVLVVTSLTEGQRATADDIAEADAQQMGQPAQGEQPQEGQQGSGSGSDSQGQGR